MNHRTRRLEPTDSMPGAEGVTVGDYWSWAYSNPLRNTDRGILAEFLVGSALGLVGGTAIRDGWEAFDFLYGQHGIEVKSSAYVQAWAQEKPYNPSFDIGEKSVWEGQGAWDPKRFRRSSVYVFCVYAERDWAQANVLDINKWEFYVVPTPLIDERFGRQKTLALSRVQEVAHSVSYADLKSQIDGALLFNPVTE